MLVENKNLFPLQLLQSRLRGYFMNANGEIFSNRGGKALAKLAGTKSTSWSPRYYTLDGTTFPEAQLIQSARNHSHFKNETAQPLLTPAATGLANRAHAQAVETGIQARGQIIGSVQNGKLSFSENPVIHMTEESLKAEMQRLATNNPGVKYVSLKITSSLVAGGLQWN